MSKDFFTLFSEINQGMSNRNRFEPKAIDFQIDGYDCVALRTDMGHWVGYVVIPENHPDYKKEYDELDYSVHGGLTYSDFLHWKESKNVGKWVIGFDFMHYGDCGGSEEQVREECNRLVQQLPKTKVTDSISKENQA